MRKILKATAALLAIICLAGCSLIQVNRDRVIVAQVGDVKITLTEYLNVAIPYFNSYEIHPLDTTQQDYIDYIEESCVEMLISDKIAIIKMAEYGIEESEADRVQAEEEAKAYFEETYQYYYDAYRTEYPTATDEEVAAAAQEYVDGFFDETYTYDDYVKSTMNQVVWNRLIDHVTTDVEVAEDEVRTQYDALVSASKESAAQGLASFETSLEEDPYFVPEGYYYVKHILIGFDEGIADEIYSLRTEDKGADADAVRNANLEKIQAIADEVLAKVDAGEDFDALIEQYGGDEGMTVEPYKSEGYLMYVGNEEYMDEFYEASIALTQDGMTSKLVATDYGYHIIKRVSTLESYTKNYDDVHDDLYETLYSQKRSDAYQMKLEEWREELGVKTWMDRIDYTGL